MIGSHAACKALSKICVTYLLAFLTVTLLQGSVWAQQEVRPTSNDPVVRLARTEARTFATALKTLAARGRVAVVAEGEPLKQALSDEEAAKLSGSDAAALTIVVTELAAAYDYDAERKGGVFILRKRYSDPRDLPGITLEECALAVRDVERLLDRFNPGMKPGGTYFSPSTKEFMVSLTPGQLQAMQERTLRIALLSPRQQAFLRWVALSSYLEGAAYNAEVAVKRFQLALTANPVFRWKEMSGHKLFGFGYPQVSEGGFVPLSAPNSVTRRDGIIFIARDHKINGIPVPPPPDPTDPLPGKDASPAKDAPAISMTLGEVVASLNAREKGKRKITVDDALAAKPVTVIGGEAVPPAQVLQALADVYGLRVVTEEDGRLRLTRRLWRIATSAGEVRNMVQRVLPEPLLRALHINTLYDLKSQIGSAQLHPPQEQQASGDANESGPKPFRPQDLIAQQKQQEERARIIPQMQHIQREVPRVLQMEIVRYLRTVIEPKIKAAEKGHVPLSSLGERERMALANILMLDCLATMDRLLSRPMPEIVTRFSELYLTGGVTEQNGKPKFSFQLSLPSSDGSLLQHGPGAANLDYTR